MHAKRRDYYLNALCNILLNLIRKIMYAKHRNYYVYSLYNIFLGSNKEIIFYKRIKQNSTVYTYVYVLHYSFIENNFLNHA